MHSMLIAAIILYIASKMTPNQRLAVKLAYFFLFLLPLSILLWRVGAWQMFFDVSWNITKAIGALFMLLLSESYGAIFR